MSSAGGGSGGSEGSEVPSARVSLRASVTQGDSRFLRIHFAVQNGESSAILVLDRLWMLDAGSNEVADPHRVYSFVKDKTLRLLLGNAPLPRFKHVLYRNVPNATPVQPGRSLEGQIELPVPVPEYSPYFKGEKPSDYADVAIESVEVFVDYIPAGPDVITLPALSDPSALSFDTPGVWERAQRLRSGLIPASTHARKRKDAFDRLVLTDENPDRP